MIYNRARIIIGSVGYFKTIIITNPQIFELQAQLLGVDKGSDLEAEIIELRNLLLGVLYNPEALVETRRRLSSCFNYLC